MHSWSCLVVEDHRGPQLAIGPVVRVCDLLLSSGLERIDDLDVAQSGRRAASNWLLFLTVTTLSDHFLGLGTLDMASDLELLVPQPLVIGG